MFGRKKGKEADKPTQEEKEEPPAPPPTAAEHVVAQIGGSLAFLEQLGELDSTSREVIETLLSPETRKNGLEEAKQRADDLKIGNRNRWLREKLSDEDTMADLITEVLAIACPGFLLGEEQQEALASLLSKSSAQFARAATDPSNQDKLILGSASAAKSAHKAMLNTWRTRSFRSESGTSTPSLAVTPPGPATPDLRAPVISISRLGDTFSSVMTYSPREGVTLSTTLSLVDPRPGYASPREPGTPAVRPSNAPPLHPRTKAREEEKTFIPPPPPRRNFQDTLVGDQKAVGGSSELPRDPS